MMTVNNEMLPAEKDKLEEIEFLSSQCFRQCNRVSIVGSSFYKGLAQIKVDLFPKPNHLLPSIFLLITFI